MKKISDRLTELPKIGKVIANDLISIGIHSPGQLARRDPYIIFNQLAVVLGHRHDLCVLYALMAVKHFIDNGEALPWWKITAEGKTLLATTNK